MTKRQYLFDCNATIKKYRERCHEIYEVHFGHLEEFTQENIYANHEIDTTNFAEVFDFKNKYSYLLYSLILLQDFCIHCIAYDRTKKFNPYLNLEKSTFQYSINLCEEFNTSDFTPVFPLETSCFNASMLAQAYAQECIIRYKQDEETDFTLNKFKTYQMSEWAQFVRHEFELLSVGKHWWHPMAHTFDSEKTKKAITTILIMVI